MTIDEALARLPIVAIVRGITADEAVAVGEVLYAGGVRAMEVPLNSPDPLESIKRLVQRFGDSMAVGAGTVLTVGQVEALHAIGGRFVVSPNTDATVIAQTLALGMESLPGIATPSEAFTAVRAGARFLKLFPAATYGPRHLKALKAVLPEGVQVLAVGGVGPSMMPEWMAVGAAGFGLGSELYTPGLPPAGVRARLSACVAAFG
jgi:2-dehydro-3-deoxyphosphogalactonate aldolase